jgi:hypothetical protein
LRSFGPAEPRRDLRMTASSGSATNELRLLILLVGLLVVT